MSRKMTEEHLEIINRVIKIHAPCYRVSGYEVEDVEQEAFIICMGIYSKWDGVRPLENFLVFSLSRRLKTFVRDKCKLQGGFADINQKIQSPIDIENVDWDTESALISEDNVTAEVEYKDLMRAIDQYLPVSLRKDYLQMKAGLKINRGRQEKIREFISILLSELGG